MLSNSESETFPCDSTFSRNFDKLSSELSDSCSSRYDGVRRAMSSAAASTKSADPAARPVLCALDVRSSCVLLVAGSNPALFHALRTMSAISCGKSNSLRWSPAFISFFVKKVSGKYLRFKIATKSS